MLMKETAQGGNENCMLVYMISVMPERILGD